MKYNHTRNRSKFNSADGDWKKSQFIIDKSLLRSRMAKQNSQRETSANGSVLGKSSEKFAATKSTMRGRDPNSFKFDSKSTSQQKFLFNRRPDS